MMRSLLLCRLAALPVCAAAARPMATDDADAAEPGSYEVEAWGEKAGSRRARVLAPACGIGAGIAVNGVGARWWLVKDALGLDLSASRQAQSGSPRQWTLGLGWYGIGL